MIEFSCVLARDLIIDAVYIMIISIYHIDHNTWCIVWVPPMLHKIYRRATSTVSVSLMVCTALKWSNFIDQLYMYSVLGSDMIGAWIISTMHLQTIIIDYKDSQVECVQLHDIVQNKIH